MNRITKEGVYLLLLLFFTTIDTLYAYDNSNTKFNYSNAPAKVWQHALVSGNGEMGIMVYGNPKEERIILNHELLYEFIGSEDIKAPYIATVMPDVKGLIKDHKYHEALQLSLDEAAKKGHTNILWTDPYHPAALMNIKQNFSNDFTNYMRKTDYSTGEVITSWSAAGVDYTRSFFVSRDNNYIVGKIESSQRNNINISLNLEHSMRKDRKVGSLNVPIFKNYPKDGAPIGYETINTPLIYPEEYRLEGATAIFRVGYKVYDRGYEVVVYVENDGGTVSNDGQSICVKNANRVEIRAKIIPIEPFSESQVIGVQKEMSRLKGYEYLLDKHKKIHSDMVNRIDLNLDKSGFKNGSNEELLLAQRGDSIINPYLLEKMFNMGIYTLVSSSGSNPPNLMGIWNGNWRPSWSGDFTTDANINLQIAAANLANLPEVIDSYMTMLERIAPDWEENAKNIYGCDGYFAGIRTSGRRNYHTHFDRFPGHYWTAGAAWLLSPCYDYYLCSGDDKFLKERLFPMMEKTALFYEGFLDTLDENNRCLFAPSYSPENNARLSSGGGFNAVANATMDIAAAKEMLHNIIEVCEMKGIKHKKIALWKKMLANMPPYIINKDGAIKEWSRDDLGDNYNHKHISHLYVSWPSHEINSDSGDLFRAACRSVDVHGRGNESAHGLTHTALVCARLKKAENVCNNLLFLINQNYIFNSLFTSHNPNLSIFNADALHAIPGIVLEMLVYSRPGVIELIPAINEMLPKGSISGVMCRTQAKVDLMEWDLNSKNVSAIISSTKNQTIRIQVAKNIDKVVVDGKSVDFQGDRVMLDFKRSKSHSIEFSWR